MKKKSVFVAGIIFLLCLLCTCSVWEAGAEDGDTAAAGEEKALGETKTKKEEEEIPQAVKFLGYNAVSEREIVFEFSQHIKTLELNFDPDMNHEIKKEGSIVTVNFLEEPKPGQRIAADFQVEDVFGNTVKEKVTFYSRNNRVPALQINELRTELSSPRAEFIEFKIRSSGNLGGLQVFAMWDEKNPMIYEFDPVEVKEGEYIILHLRTLEALCKNEYGGNLAESGGTDSSPTARDFWKPGSERLLHNTDAIYVLDQDGRVLDAVMLTENSASWGGRAGIAKAAEFLFSQKIWTSPKGTICTPVDAVNSGRTSATQTICRDETTENTHTAADWYITVTSGTTPGALNNPNRLKL